MLNTIITIQDLLEINECSIVVDFYMQDSEQKLNNENRILKNIVKV